MGAPRLANGITLKQEAFAQGVASGLSQHDAYLAAGYSDANNGVTIDSHASHLADDGRVGARIADLLQEHAAEAKLSRGNIALELQSDREFARSKGNPVAAIKATELRGDIIDAFGKRERRITGKVTHVLKEYRDKDTPELLGIVDAAYRELDEGDGGEDAPHEDAEVVDSAG